MGGVWGGCLGVIEAGVKGHNRPVMDGVPNLQDCSVSGPLIFPVVLEPMGQSQWRYDAAPKGEGVDDSAPPKEVDGWDFLWNHVEV